MNNAIRNLLLVASLASLPMIGFAQDSSGDASGGGRGQKLMAKFKAADTNGDGQLSKDEMSKGMPRLAAHFDEIDTNHDGQVSKQELVTYLRARKAAKSGSGAAGGAPDDE